MRKEELELQKKQLEAQLQGNQLLQKAIEQGLPLLHQYFQTKLEKVESPKIRLGVIGFLVILLVMTLVSGGLVALGKLDSSSFTFFLGTMIGAAVTFLGELILPPS
ncbi:MAG TPA: hypothetical protein VJB87_01995 [Candidatus Nanoarchaeia archaeon]|nr:hypothetical protein [Candidatus Nanoarchaeia archaeon]